MVAEIFPHREKLFDAHITWPPATFASFVHRPIGLSKLVVLPHNHQHCKSISC